MPLILRFTLSGPAVHPFQHAVGMRTVALRWIAAADPDLAASVRSGDGPRPYSLGPLLAANGAARPGPLSLEMGLLDDRLLAALQTGMLRSGPNIVLGSDGFRVEEVVPCHATTWEQLAAPDPDWSAAAFELCTPTAHHLVGALRRSAVLPDPGRYFGTWLDRWNRFGPEGLRMPSSVLEVVNERMVISDCRGGTAHTRLDKARAVVGFVGRVRFELMEVATIPPESRSALARLARLAPYCGTGVETQRGLGVTRPLTDAEIRPPRRR